MKHIAGLFMAMIAFWGSTSMAGASEKELTVLSHPFAPWQFFNDETGRVEGINIDIAKHIFQKMNIPVKFKQYPWAKAWDTVKKGKADAVLSASRKKPREPYLYYPKEDMWTSEYVFFVRKDKKKKTDIAGNYAEIKKDGGIVGIVSGYSYNKNFWAAFPYRDGSTEYNPDRRDYHPQIRSVATPDINLKKLARNRISFFINDKSIGLYMIKTLKMRKSTTHYDAVLFSKGYPMPFAKKSDYPGLEKIAEQFEQELVRLKKDGTYTQIVDKWLK